MKVHASFVVAFNGDKICATTRAADRGESGKIGLPGGKVDPGESGQEAAKREASEEGWNIKYIDINPFYSQIVEGKLVQWFYGFDASPLDTFKEKGRISPILSSINSIKNSGFGNDNALNALIN